MENFKHNILITYKLSMHVNLKKTKKKKQNRTRLVNKKIKPRKNEVPPS